MHKFFNVAVSNTGNVYIADSDNQRIRKVTVSTGIITTIAGTGTSSYSGDNGDATSANLYYPYGVAVDSSGAITTTILLLLVLSTALFKHVISILCALLFFLIIP